MVDWVYIGITSGTGVMLLAASTVVIFRRISFKRNAAITKARIMEYRCNPSSCGRRFYPAFEMQIDGEVETVDSEFGFNPPVGMIGDTVTVMYNKKNHAQCMIPEFRSMWGTGLFMGSMGWAIIIAGILI